MRTCVVSGLQEDSWVKRVRVVDRVGLVVRVVIRAKRSFQAGVKIVRPARLPKKMTNRVAQANKNVNFVTCANEHTPKPNL